jgi:hypothetical protein
VAAISTLSAPGSRVIVYYQASSVTDRIRRRAARVFDRVAGLDDPFADEPWLSVWRPSSMRRVMSQNGLVVESDIDMLAVAQRLGTDASHPSLMANGRVLTARR